MVWSIALAVLLVLLLVHAGDASHQLLANPSFEDTANFEWQPFLGGYYLDRDGNGVHGRNSVSLTPSHFYGVWQGIKLAGDTAPAKAFTLVAYANTEWLYDARASVSVDLRFTDNTHSYHNTIVFTNGVLGYQRMCAIVTVPVGKTVESATVFAVATPLSSAFGTVWLDSVELHAHADGPDARLHCDGGTPRLAGADVAHPFSLAKKGPDPSSWAATQSRVCAVVVLELSEVDYLAQLAELWRLPIVAVVYVGNADEAEAEFSRIDSTVASFHNTKLLIVSASDKSAHTAPWNFMRQSGEAACPAAHVLHLEHGMMPSASLSPAFFQKLAFPANTIYVVPSVVLTGAAPLAARQQVTDKNALKALMAKHEQVVTPFQTGRHALSYWSTNYSHWIDATEPYAITLLVSGARVVHEMGVKADASLPSAATFDGLLFNRHYAPVIIVPTRHAVWDARFVHRGHAKASYMVEAFLRKTRFVVLSEGFVTLPDVAAPVASHDTVLISNAYAFWKLYCAFLSEKVLSLSTDRPVDLQYLRAMPAADPDVDHRVETALWRRGLIALCTLFVAAVVLRHLLMLPPPPGSSFGSAWHGSVRGQVKEL